MLEKVLVVNDNELLLMIAEKMIKIGQFSKEIITATDGLKALDYFDHLIKTEINPADKAPAFVFLDLHMPNMDGWEFLKNFSKEYYRFFPDLKVAILSASVEMDEILQLLEYPFVVDFINTPINESVLDDIKQKYFKLQFETEPA